MLISKEQQHWRYPVKKLGEEPGNKITGLAGKTRGKEKLKIIWINQFYG